MEEKVEWMDGVVVERGRSDLKLGRVGYEQDSSSSLSSTGRMSEAATLRWCISSKP